MKSRVALKRLWQETAPATYMKDFDKKQCCDAIEKDLEVLEIFKSKIGLNYIPIQSDIKQEKYILTGAEITEEEYEKIKEWLEKE